MIWKNCLLSLKMPPGSLKIWSLWGFGGIGSCFQRCLLGICEGNETNHTKPEETRNLFYFLFGHCQCLVENLGQPGVDESLESRDLGNSLWKSISENQTIFHLFKFCWQVQTWVSCECLPESWIFVDIHQVKFSSNGTIFCRIVERIEAIKVTLHNYRRRHYFGSRIDFAVLSKILESFGRSWNLCWRI